MKNQLDRSGPTTVLALIYALPNVSMAMLWTPLTVMQGIYVKYFGFSMQLLAAILLASRVYDAVADIAVGGFSDWGKAKTGRRKPLFAMGSVVFAIAGLFVYAPPITVGPFYLTFWLFAFFTGYALLSIPHFAWGTELARNSRQKTRLFSYRTAAGYLGLCVFYSIPLLPVFQTSDITPKTIKLSAYLAIAILASAVVVCLKFVPEGRRTTAASMERSAFSLIALRALFRHRPLGLFMAAYIFCGVGLGIWYGMIFIFVDIYLRQGALFAPLYLFAFSVGVFASLGWNWIAGKCGKKTAWSVGMSLACAGSVATEFVTPKNASLWSLGLLLVVNTIAIVSYELLTASILGDVADHAQLKSGRNQSGTYFAMFMFATKVIFALGGAIGLGIAAWLGFDPHGSDQPARGVLALSIVMSWLPGMFLAIGIILIQLIPIDERRHATIRKRLDQRETRATDGTVRESVETAEQAATANGVA